MKQKLIILAVIFYFYVTSVASSPLDKRSRDQNLTSHSNSLYVRDVMRLAKAAEMRNYMDESVNPCTDFYEFACGNWAKINPAVSQGETGYFHQLASGMKRKKSNLLQLSSSADSWETPIEKKVKDFYRSCMKAEGVKQNAFKIPLQTIIEEFGTMPALDPNSWNASQFDWLSTIAKIKSVYGISIILGSEIMVDFENNTVNRFYIWPPPLQLKVRSMYLGDENKKYRDDYRDLMKDQLINAMELPSEKAMQVANDILNFEIELAKGLPDEKADASQRENLKTIVEQLQLKYAPEIDIQKYVLIYLGKPIEGLIYETEENYQINLLKVLNGTSQETLANYIFFKLISGVLPDETGRGASRIKYCEGITEMFFSEMLENMIYRRFDFRKTERDIKLISTEIKKVFEAKLRSNEVNWLSESTRQSALRKLEATKFEITSYKDSNFTEEFGEAEINDSDFLQNLINVYKNYAKNKKAELYRPKPKKLPGSTHTPLFSHTDNTVKIPVALLQPNYFWAPHYPQAIKFGTIGALMGHEIIHGFADKGIRFDGLGNKRLWFDSKSFEALKDRTECFREQYRRYRYGGILLPNAEDQSENVADNGGLRLAYEAYLRWHTEAERMGKDLSMETLPRLKYSDKELFFLSFAQTWCDEIHINYIQKKMNTDEHTIAKFRVIGTLSNCNDFSEVFSCKANDRMNPKNKCIVY